MKQGQDHGGQVPVGQGSQNVGEQDPKCEVEVEYRGDHSLVASADEFSHKHRTDRSGHTPSQAHDGQARVGQGEDGELGREKHQQPTGGGQEGAGYQDMSEEYIRLSVYVRIYF